MSPATRPPDPRRPFPLRAGRRARAWADGAIAESCPAQGRALAVQVVDG